MGDFVRHQKEGTKFEKRNYRRKENEIKDVVRDLRLRYKSISPLKDTDGSDGEERRGFFGDFEKIKLSLEEIIRNRNGGHREIIDTFRNDTEAWGEAPMQYGELK